MCGDSYFILFLLISLGVATILSFFLANVILFVMYLFGYQGSVDKDLLILTFGFFLFTGPFTAFETYLFTGYYCFTLS